MNAKHIALPAAAILAIVLLRVAGVDVTDGDDAYTVASAPTPYSHSHAVAMSRPGEPEPLPPQF